MTTDDLYNEAEGIVQYFGIPFLIGFVLARLFIHLVGRRIGGFPASFSPNVVSAMVGGVAICLPWFYGLWDIHSLYAFPISIVFGVWVSFPLSVLLTLVLGVYLLQTLRAKVRFGPYTNAIYFCVCVALIAWEYFWLRTFATRS